MEHLLFDNMDKLGRIVITSALVYLLIVVVTKLSGKRATSQLNNFDWVVTVMIGSIGASTILLKSIPFVEGSAAIITLFLLQYLVTKYTAISPQFTAVILSEPTVVFYHGQFLPEAMKKERLNRQELECAMRSEGIHNFEEVEAIVFESDAKLTVIPKKEPANSDKPDNTDSPVETPDTLIIPETIQPLT